MKISTTWKCKSNAFNGCSTERQHVVEKTVRTASTCLLISIQFLAVTIVGCADNQTQNVSGNDVVKIQEEWHSYFLAPLGLDDRDAPNETLQEWSRGGCVVLCTSFVICLTAMTSLQLQPRWLFLIVPMSLAIASFLTAHLPRLLPVRILRLPPCPHCYRPLR